MAQALSTLPPSDSSASQVPTATVDWYRYRAPLLRLLRDRSPRRILEYLEEGKQRGGDFVKVSLGPLQFYIVSDPEAIEYVLVRNWRNYKRGEPPWTYVTRGLGQGLVTSDGPLHEQERKLLQPLFQPRRVAAFGGIIAQATERIARDWRTRSGEVTDVHADMMRLTMLVISRVLFGLDMEDEAERAAEAVTDLNAAATSFDASAAGFLYFMPTRVNRRFRRALAYLYELTARVTAEQQERGPEENVLSQLLLARESGQAPQLDDALLRDELVTLFGAGHETTSNMLAWTFLLLAQNPEAEARLHAELDSVLGGRPPTPEDLPQLPYTDRVLKESMRIYPPVWGNQRVAIQDDVVGGRHLPAGAQVSPIPWLVHRDPRWFPDPLRFDPDRFAPEAIRARPRFAYFPFGGGDRVCVGQAFAELEGTLVLASLAQEFTPRLLPDYEVEVEPLVSLRPKGGLPMRLVARN